MYRNIFINFFLLVLINFLGGCYSSDQIYKEQLATNYKKIVEVVVLNGDVITFNDNGAKYIKNYIEIVGTSDEGIEIILPLKDISELRKEKVPAVPLEEIGTDRITETLNLVTTISKSTIKKFIRLYKFNDEGGIYNQEDDVIRGITEDGLNISFKPHQIFEIHTQLPQAINKEELTQTENLFISQVLLIKDNQLITFDNKGASYLQYESGVAGITQENNTVYINDSDIQYVNTSSQNRLLTGLFIGGIVVSSLLVASSLFALIK